MVFGKFTIVVVASLLSLGAAEECLWTSTHCSCTEVSGGSCFRKIDGVSPPLCSVDTCGAGHKCDCLGKKFCKIETCDTWRNVVDGAPALSAGASDVPCKLVSTASCLSVVEMPVTEPPTTTEPEVYKMVQIGEQSEPTLFNMTWQTDVNNYIMETDTYFNDKWPENASLRQRQLNFRLYKSDNGSKSFVCIIINRKADRDSLGKPVKDGLGNALYEANFVIESVAGHQLKFTQCDEPWECVAPTTGTTLTTNFRGAQIYTDGTCVTLPSDGSAVSVKTTNVQNLVGMNFLGNDASVDEYMFATGDAGMSGSVDGNGVVSNGAVPEIIIKPAGILAQY